MQSNEDFLTYRIFTINSFNKRGTRKKRNGVLSAALLFFCSSSIETQARTGRDWLAGAPPPFVMKKSRPPLSF
jgi:hypothetical protein